MNGTECPLCRAEHLTKRLHEDDLCWAAYCSSHPKKIIVVLKRHAATPTPEETEHVWEVAGRLFPGTVWRGPASIPDHFHLHEA